MTSPTNTNSMVTVNSQRSTLTRFAMGNHFTTDARRNLNCWWGGVNSFGSTRHGNHRALKSKLHNQEVEGAVAGKRCPAGTILRLLVALCLGSCGAADAEGAKNVIDSHASNTYVGNEACSRCHASIYESYQRTPMAHASGPALENLQPGSFVHAKSGVHYRIFSEDGKAWLSFERPGDPAVKGKRQLLYFIGSGQRGRTYLFSVDGFVFESPINWYAGRKIWDMAPAYSEARQIPMNLPAYTSCLRCHTSGMQLPVKDTENEYPVPLFKQNAVGCERCHGPGSEHAEDPKGNPILNPLKLTAERRDSVCMQCHLEANVAIERAGRHAYNFRPGDILDDYVRHYVLASDQSS